MRTRGGRRCCGDWQPPGGRTDPASRCRAPPRRAGAERRGPAPRSRSTPRRRPRSRARFRARGGCRSARSRGRRRPAPGSVCSSCAIRRVEWHHDLQRAPGWLYRRSEPSRPERADALAHAGQSHVAGALQPLRAQVRRAAPVVAHSEPHYVPANAMPTSTDRAPACRRTLDSASCSARNRASSASSGSGGRTAGAVSSMLYVAPCAEVGDQRAQRRQQPEVVEQRGPEIVGDAADAPDAGVDQLERVIEPLGLLRLRPPRGARPAPSSPRRTPAPSRRAARARAGGAPPRAAPPFGRTAGPAPDVRACRRV